MEAPPRPVKEQIYHTLETHYHPNPVLPKEGERNVLITSALPYVNAVPHLGNLIGSLLSADVYARYCRLRGYNTLFICGTDEYGTATEVAALREGVSPLELCTKYNKLHNEIYSWFGLSFDNFGRTTTQQQTAVAQAIFTKAYENGCVEEQPLDQFYCETCKMFLADRFVVGTCPHCGYDGAKGDQCDKCQALLNPSDLKEPRCAVKCGKTPVLKTTKHLFLSLPKIEPMLQSWFQESSVKGSWSANSVQVTSAWLKGGLKPRCISRDLRWGTPIPLPGYENKVFYVWFDAPIGYISMTMTYTEQWEKWWKNPKQVQLVMFMGKDNIPFHTIIFPSSLLATKEPWTLLHHISTTEYLNYEGTKFSKTNKIGVFGDDAKTTGVPPEVWRYYLLVNRPESSDTNFLWEDFQAKNNAELLGKLGNFVNRALKFVEASFNSELPAVGPLTEVDTKLVAAVNEELKGYLEAMERVALKDGLRFVMAVSELGNGYLQSEQPWVLIKSNPARCASVLAIATNLVSLLVSLCDPFMPSFSEKVRSQLNLPRRSRLPEVFAFDNPAGHKIGVPVPLFKKIENEELEGWKARFSPCTFDFDIRTGQIVKVEPHPSADRLYLVDVSLGKETRSVVAGLKEHYTVEQLLQQPCLLLCNLKAATIQGAKSNGMLLVAAPKTGPMRLLQLQDSKLPLGSVVLPAVVARENPEEVVPFILAVKPNLDLKKDFQKLDFRTVDDTGEIHLVSEEQKPAMKSKLVVLVCKTSPAVRARAPPGTAVGAQVK